MLDFLAALFGTSKTAVVAGGAGAGVAALISKRRKVERAITFIVGFCAATFGTTAILAWIATDATKYEGGVGFMLGLFGMSVAEALFRLIENTDWSGIIKGRFGGDK